MKLLRTVILFRRWRACRKAGHPTSIVRRIAHRREFFLESCKCRAIERREVVPLNRQIERQMTRRVKRSKRELHARGMADLFPRHVP